ncbi:MAG: P-loop NTPase [Candidatus Bathyarchaeia archaeon]|jgi:MinD superfamily P-loop ATPase
MKQLTVLSGKGGTGKTSITACLAVLASNSVVADCDVDAPDLHMLLHPEVFERQTFMGSKVAVIDPKKCVKCGSCKTQCRFDAVTEALTVDPTACEGCGVCLLACKVEAVSLAERTSGSTYLSKTRFGFMSHAMLYPGEANSGKLVTLVRQNAKILAYKEKLDLILVDGPPGIGCPVIASVSGVDAALIVVEPTFSGIHDLKRVLQLLNHFKVKPYVCVNMYDINLENTQAIITFCQENNAEFVGKISFDPKFTEAMVNGKTLIEYAPTSLATEEIKIIWEKMKNSLFKEDDDSVK